MGLGGGLMVYVPSHLLVRRRIDLEMDGIECIWLELHFPARVHVLYVLFTACLPTTLPLQAYWPWRK